TEARPSPRRLSAMIVGSSRKWAETSGLALIRSPAATVIVFACPSRSRASVAPSRAAPPSRSCRRSPAANQVCGPGGGSMLPWKSLSPRICTVSIAAGCGRSGTVAQAASPARPIAAAKARRRGQDRAYSIDVLPLSPKRKWRPLAAPPFPCDPLRVSELVADTDLDAPDRRTDVDLVVGLVAGQPGIRIDDEIAVRAEDVAAFGVDAGQRGDVLQPGEIAPPLDVPVVVEEVEEVVERGEQLEPVVDAEERARARDFLRERQVEVVVPVVRAGVPRDRLSHVLLRAAELAGEVDQPLHGAHVR